MVGIKGSGVLLSDPLEDFGLVTLLLICFSPLRSKLVSVSQSDILCCWTDLEIEFGFLVSSSDS